MFYLWATVFSVLNLVWLMLNIVSLPGNWLMLASAGVLAWLYWPTEIFSKWTLIFVFVLALAGEVIDFFAGMVGAKWAGAGKGAGLAAIVGGIVGALAGTAMIPVPVLGSLMGAVIGAGLGAAIVELQSGRKAGSILRSGVGSGLGQLLGKVAKLLLGMLIWIVLTVAVFWP